MSNRRNVPRAASVFQPPDMTSDASLSEKGRAMAGYGLDWSVLLGGRALGEIIVHLVARLWWIFIGGLALLFFSILG